MRITFPHSHAFPGGRLTITEVGATKPSATNAGWMVVVP